MVKTRAGSSSAPSEWALRQLPARVITFLRVVATHTPIRAALVEGGYRESDHAEGFRLLMQACKFDAVGQDPTEDDEARKAEKALHSWAQTHLARLEVAVKRLHPKSVELFKGLQSGEPAASVLAVTTLLARLDQEPSAAVLSTLATRGLSKQKRATLQTWVDQARAVRAPTTPVALDQNDAQREGANESLLELSSWYEDWSVTARAFISRKDWLIRLGLLRRRRPGAAS